MTTDIKDDGWNRWHQTSIKNIEVKNGEVEIGFILMVDLTHGVL